MPQCWIRGFCNSIGGLSIFIRELHVYSSLEKFPNESNISLINLKICKMRPAMIRAWFRPNFGWLQFSHLWLVFRTILWKISKLGCILLNTLYYRILIVDVVNNRRQKVKTNQWYFWKRTWGVHPSNWPLKYKNVQ